MSRDSRSIRKGRSKEINLTYSRIVTRLLRLLSVGVVICLPLGCGKGTDPNPVPTDKSAPSQVSDLTASSVSASAVMLHWTAVGDDGMSGRASAYDIRRSTSAITASNYASAEVVSNQISPAEPGAQDSALVSSLDGGTLYYFAVRARDEAQNFSPISAAATALTYQVGPTPVLDLEIAGSSTSTIALRWTAPSGGSSATAASYDIRYSTSLATLLDWKNASQVIGEPSPQTVGRTESFTVTNLTSSTAYYFALRATDQSQNESSASNTVGALTSSIQPGFALAGQTTTGKDSRGVAVAGKFAYTADYTSGISIYDISNYLNPKLLSSIDTPGRAYKIAVQGNFAYVADGSKGLQIVGIANPNFPSLLGSKFVSGEAVDVKVLGNFAYLAASGAGLQIFDISDPMNLRLAGSFDTPDVAQGIFVDGIYAYVACDTKGLFIFDISNPSSPRKLSEFDTPGDDLDVVVRGSYAYVASSDRGLMVINVTDPANPSLSSNFDTDKYANGIAISGQSLFMTAFDDDLFAFDLTNPASPSYVTLQNQQGSSYDVATEGNLVFLASNSHSFYVYLFSPPQ